MTNRFEQHTPNQTRNTDCMHSCVCVCVSLTVPGPAVGGAGASGGRQEHPARGAHTGGAGQRPREGQAEPV